MKKIIIFIFVLISIIILAGIYKFNYLSNQKGYDVDGNKIKLKINKEYYKNLKKKCNESKFKDCCLDSVKTMEVIGAYKFGDFNVNKCIDGYEIMKLRCFGAYILCQPKNEFKDNNSKPVPESTIKLKIEK